MAEHQATMHIHESDLILVPVSADAFLFDDKLIASYRSMTILTLARIDMDSDNFACIAASTVIIDGTR
jgi:hypothetical protein